MEWCRPDTGTARTGCFDSVPSAASARDGTPLSMTRDFVTQPDKQGKFHAGRGKKPREREGSESGMEIGVRLQLLTGNKVTFSGSMTLRRFLAEAGCPTAALAHFGERGGCAGLADEGEQGRFGVEIRVPAKHRWRSIIQPTVGATQERLTWVCA